MSDGVLTRALADLSRAGIPIAAALDPARRDDLAPGTLFYKGQRNKAVLVYLFGVVRE